MDYADLRDLPTRQHAGIPLAVPVPKTNATKKAPIYMGGILWNALPTNIQVAPTVDIFKQLVKDYQTQGI